MIPTLAGRWQTRLLLFALIGLPITLIYALYLTGGMPPPAGEPFAFLTLILVLGLLLDVVYIEIQRFRWDNDWPFAFQFFFSILEFLAAYGLVRLGILDWLIDDPIPFSTAVIHFTWVFIPSFIAVLGGVAVFLVRWRYKGGELGKHPVR